jgi:hypothetical protein
MRGPIYGKEAVAIWQPAKDYELSHSCVSPPQHTNPYGPRKVESQSAIRVQIYSSHPTNSGPHNRKHRSVMNALHLSTSTSPQTRRSVRISMARNDSSTSTGTPISTPSTSSFESIEVFSYDYLEREAKANRLFRRMARSWMAKEGPSESQINEFNDYADIITPQMLVQWREKLDSSIRVEFWENRIIFTEYPTYPHDQIVDLLQDQFSEQMNSPYPYQFRRFVSDGTTGIFL